MRMSRITFFITGVFLLFALCLKAQKVSVNADDKPLNKVLLELRERQHLKFSFDDELLSHYTISLHQIFQNSDEAIETLLKPFPLTYNKQQGVYVIYPKISKTRQSPETVLFSGYIREKGTGEPLPYSHIIINEKPFLSDLSGYFSQKITADSLVEVKISHLGYYILDTLLSVAKTHNIALIPAIINLKEVKITGRHIDFATQIGQRAGVMKLNSKVASYLPGYGDNSVFNLLRLQAGILASGEQTNELIIWGSYEGQSKVMFDGFTVYGLKNFNDNISSFNPLMAKDIEVMKGGFDARYGERVGGIVNITGINGDTKHTRFTLNVNNMTINTIVEVPIRKTASLVIAFRHTYFNLYNPTQYTIHRNDSSGTIHNIDINVVPKYVFRDLNIKYSGKTKDNNLYYISLYAGGDNFNYIINQKIYFRKILKNTSENNLQFGGSLFYGKTWKNGWTSNFSISSSALTEKYNDNYRIEKLWNHTFDTLNIENSLNKLGEFRIKVDNVSPLTQIHTLEWGGGLIADRSLLNIDTFGSNLSNLNMQAGRLQFYLQDKIQLGNHLSFRVGYRFNYAANLRKKYIEPRLSAEFSFNKYWKINFAWGIYNQFITKTSTLDNQGNYRYLWAVCDNINIPVLQSVHNVLGLSFFKNNFTFSAETYYKTIQGLTRFVHYKNIVTPDLYHGNSRSYGLDLMIKKDFRRNTAWIAYSLAKTEEHFSYFPDGKYRRAPQDQRHELKLAVLINLFPFFLSANYVYGSGFPVSYSQQQRIKKNYPYSRLDASVSYKFLNRKLKGELGLSIMNLLNTQNIKFSNFERIPLNQTSGINLYAEAIPFTPTIYLNISL